MNCKWYSWHFSPRVFCEQRDTNGLTAENSELKLRLQTIEQQVHLQDGKGFVPPLSLSPLTLKGISREKQMIITFLYVVRM